MNAKNLSLLDIMHNLQGRNHVIFLGKAKPKSGHNLPLLVDIIEFRQDLTRQVLLFRCNTVRLDWMRRVKASRRQ